MGTERSHVLYGRAQQRVPGGVNSPVRAWKAVGGDPLFIARADGAHVFDADDNVYLDYVGSWGPLILGHAHPKGKLDQALVVDHEQDDRCIDGGQAQQFIGSQRGILNRFQFLSTTHLG